VRTNNSDLTNILGKNQRKLLKELRSQTKEIAEILKVVAVSQDVDAVRKEQMEFLGVVGSRVLSPEEIELSKEGIRFDDLRRICGRKIDNHIRREGFRNSLPQGHILRMVFAEHEMILYYASDLEKVTAAVQKMNTWAEAEKLADKISHLIKHLCSMDAHITREEQVIMPHLQACGYSSAPSLVQAEHTKLRNSRVELRKLADAVRKSDFGPWVAMLCITVADFVPAIREHIRKEEAILYPNAVSIIQDAEKWAEMKTACDEISICCFESND
jgi:uncharacterized protein